MNPQPNSTSNKHYGRYFAATMGDPAGIGPDILLRGLAHLGCWQRAVVIGDCKLLSALLATYRDDIIAATAIPKLRVLHSVAAVRQYLSRAKHLSPDQADQYSARTAIEDSKGAKRLPQDLHSETVEELLVLQPKLPYVSGWEGALDRRYCGKFEAAEAGAVAESIDLAIELVRAGVVSGLYTGPIAKAQIALVRPGFRGHTEYLAAACNSSQVVMLMMNSGLRTVPLTGHIPVAQVAGALQISEICSKVLVVQQHLLQDQGITQPQLALGGLNPHAGEQGLVGSEEQRILQPAAKLLRQQGVQITDPLSVDSLFLPAIRNSYDCIFCPLHDQALIPVKALGFENLVNVTLGLPFLRVSPGHGPGYQLAKDIASKKFSASAASAIAAIKLLL